MHPIKTITQTVSQANRESVLKQKGKYMFKKIYVCRSSAEAGMVISLLKSNGFNPMELQTSPLVGIAGADLYYYVQIPVGEYESAKEFLLTNDFKDVLD